MGTNNKFHRIEVATPGSYQKSQLTRLNHELDSLYETIYDDWTTITEDDYKVFGAQFHLLIQTVKQLYDACRKLPKEMGLKDEIRKLGMNYSALYELNSDIVNFRIYLLSIHPRSLPWGRKNESFDEKTRERDFLPRRREDEIS